jgi:hypothetical protein
MKTLLSRIVSHHKRGQTRLDLLIDSGDIGVDAVDPAKHVRETGIGDGRRDAR